MIVMMMVILSYNIHLCHLKCVLHLNPDPGSSCLDSPSRRQPRTPHSISIESLALHQKYVCMMRHKRDHIVSHSLFYYISITVTVVRTQQLEYFYGEGEEV